MPRRLLRWPLPLAFIWLALPVLALAAVASLAPLAPNDYWWPLAQGRAALALGHIPDSNTFLYTLPADTPFFNQPWLAQLIFEALARLDHGLNSSLHALCLVIAWSGLLVLGYRRCHDARLTGVLGLLAAALCATLFAVRTQMFAFPLFVGLMACLFGVLDGWLKPKRALVASTLLTALWANLHGTFILAPVLTAICGAGQLGAHLLDARRLPPKDELLLWIGWPLLLLLATLLSPHGPYVYVYVLKLAVLSDISTTAQEWLPLSIDEPLGQAFASVVLAILALLLRRRRELSLSEVLLCAAGLYLGTSQRRSLFWFIAPALLVVLPQVSAIFAASSSAQEEEETTQAQGIAHAVALGLVVVGLVLCQPFAPGYAPLQRALFADRTRAPAFGGQAHSVEAPIALVDQLARYGWSGRLFHDQHSAGLLEYRLSPPKGSPIVFLDQRFELTPPQLWEQYFALSAAQQGWDEAMRERGIATMMLSAEEQWPLVQAAATHPGWVLVARDQLHLLFIRAEADEVLTRWRRGPSGTSPERGSTGPHPPQP